MDGKMEVPDTANDTTVHLHSVLRDGLSYLAAVSPPERTVATAPLLVIEFLHKIADTFVLYFGEPADESAVKDNFSTCYQLLEEMVDHGWPLTTEPNALTDLIRPPTVMGKVRGGKRRPCLATTRSISNCRAFQYCLNEPTPYGNNKNRSSRRYQVDHLRYSRRPYPGAPCRTCRGARGASPTPTTRST